VSSNIIAERSSGIWSRVAVAGVKPHLFVISHFIKGLIVVSIQVVLLCTFTCTLLSQVQTFNAVSLIISIVTLNGIFAIFFGVFMSTISETVEISMIFTQAFLYASLCISGVLWPMESQPKFLQFIGYSLPFAYPASAIKSVAFKDSTVFNHDVKMAVLIFAVWIIVNFTLSLVLMKRKGCRRN
jgi:ABC-2 type transport system permease protein